MTWNITRESKLCLFVYTILKLSILNHWNLAFLYLTNSNNNKKKNMIMCCWTVNLSPHASLVECLQVCFNIRSNPACECIFLFYFDGLRMLCASTFGRSLTGFRLNERSQAQWLDHISAFMLHLCSGGGMDIRDKTYTQPLHLLFTDRCIRGKSIRTWKGISAHHGPSLKESNLFVMFLC